MDGERNGLDRVHFVFLKERSHLDSIFCSFTRTWTGVK
jgi:hypothetical protein